MIVLSHFQAGLLLEARSDGIADVECSLDLNRTCVTVHLNPDGVLCPGGVTLGWQQVERVAADTNKCFIWRDGQFEDIRVFSETTNWSRSLFPTACAPTTLVAGLTMHRIVGTDPLQDTAEKIRAVRPSGLVLDTATGLGYTAIAATSLPDVERVITVELDPAALEIARLNPWSQELFNHPKIEQIVADVFDVVEQAPDASYATIIHDPPTIKLAGDLYSADFYVELFRALKPRGRLFHYIGDPASPAGKAVSRGVVERLTRVGFRRVTPVLRAFGVVAHK